jgi:hypothetical protein
MMVMGSRLTYAMIPVLAIAAAALAFAGASVAVNQTILGYSYNFTNCKTNFTTSYLAQISRYTANSTRASALGAAESNLTQYSLELKSYAASGDVTSYRSYLAGTYDPELSRIRGLAVLALGAGNTTAASTAQLITYYNGAKSQYEKCAYSSLRQFATEKLNAYQQQLAQHEAQADNLSSKGVDVSVLRGDISAANSTVVVPFAAAISQSTNSTELQAAINKYCLFDGCPKGINAHLDAHFSSDLVTAIISKAQTFNLTANQSAAVSVAQGDLAKASSALQQAGTSAYTSGQEATIWSSLRSAAAVLKGALKGG